MGKKSKSKASKRVSGKRGPKPGGASSGGSGSEVLVAHAEAALSQMQIENALGYYEQALSMDAENTTIMDSLADIYLSLGESDRAISLLLQSTQLSPEDNPGKYLYIAQLQQGEEALSSYQQALHFLALLRRNNEDLNAVSIIDKQLIKSYCGIAELYLTDLCYNTDAEQHCEEAIGQALGIDQFSVDANHALANVRLSQSKPIEASVLVEGVYKKIHEVRQRINCRTVIEDLHAPEHVDLSEHIAEPDIPSLEICVSTVKLMLECAAVKPSLAEDALVFAAELLNDDDENIELWYIAGVAAMTTSPPDYAVALHYFEQAMSMIDALKQFPDMQDGIMDEHYTLIVDHIAMIKSQQQGQIQMAVNGENNVPQNDTEVEEWSSDEDGDDEEGGGGGRMEI